MSNYFQKMLSESDVKCIFCGDLIHERSVTKHLEDYHQIKNLFFTPKFKDAQTQIDPDDTKIIYGRKPNDGQESVLQTEYAEESRNVRQVETDTQSANMVDTDPSVSQDIVLVESNPKSVEANLEPDDERIFNHSELFQPMNKSLQRFRCPQCKFFANNTVKVEEHIMKKHTVTPRKSRKRKLQTSPVKQTMCLYLDVVRIPFEVKGALDPPPVAVYTPTLGPVAHVDVQPRRKRLKQAPSDRRESPRILGLANINKPRVLRSGQRQKHVTKRVKKSGRCVKKPRTKNAKLDSWDKHRDTGAGQARRGRGRPPRRKKSSLDVTEIGVIDRGDNEELSAAVSNDLMKHVTTDNITDDNTATAKSLVHGNMTSVGVTDVENNVNVLTELDTNISSPQRIIETRPRKNTRVGRKAPLPMKSKQIECRNMKITDNAQLYSEDNPPVVTLINDDLDCVILEEVASAAPRPVLTETEQFELQQILETCANSGEAESEDSPEAGAVVTSSDVSTFSLASVATPPPGPSRPCQCPQCPAKFDTAEQLRLHLAGCSPGLDTDTDSSSAVTSSLAPCHHLAQPPAQSHRSIKTDNVAAIKSIVSNIYVRFVQTYYSTYKRRFPYLSSADLIQKLKEGYKVLRESDHSSIRKLQEEYARDRREMLNGKIKTIVKSLEEEGCADFQINV